jgi:UrcA family protein
MNKTTIRNTLLAGLAGVVLAGSTLASAADIGVTQVTTSAEGVRSAAVSYADLDLSDATARETLHYRIRRAARDVCGSAHVRVAGSVRRASENQACFERAMDQAMSQLSRSQLALVD